MRLSSSQMYPGAWDVMVDGVRQSTSCTPFSRSWGNIAVIVFHTRSVRSVGPARKLASPSYGV